MKTEQYERIMLQTGMINGRVFAGSQPDIMRVPQTKGDRTVDGRWCDHDCLKNHKGEPTGGNYTCNSSKSLNPGIKPGDITTAEVIITWLKTLVAGHHLARDLIVEKLFPGYCAEWNIPLPAAEALKNGLTDPAKKVELNLFGGNPELHPELFEIIREMQKPEHGALVNLTTTGRQLVFNQHFVEKIIENPPNVLALSFDDLKADELTQLHYMKLPELKSAWLAAMKAENRHGQRHKAFEAVYSARLVSDLQLPTMILFNMVIHPGNVDRVPQMVETAGKLYPKSVTNPYHAQGSMNHEPGSFPHDSLHKFGRLNDWLIEQTVAGHPNINKRLHYYLFMKAIFERWQDEPAVLADWITGHQAWQCFRNPGAARYAQLGGSPKPWDDLGLVQIAGTAATSGKPLKQNSGGHLGCFWNDETVTMDSQLKTPETVAWYILEGAVKLAAKSAKPCPGCIMPRLIFDVISLELGMHPELKPAYLALRKLYAGY
jgi:hypothetical protein